MSDKPLPQKLQERFNVRTVNELWQLRLSEGNTSLSDKRHFFGRFPSNPRCVSCHRPYKGPGGLLFRILYKDQVKPSAKNPRFCNACYGFTDQFPGGAEIELTMLFVDVRGSTTLAEKMNDTAFSELMNRFYRSAINVLVHENAFIDKLVGDEVTALFIPGYSGPDHAVRGARAGTKLLEVTGHGQGKTPWVPVGVGVHTGRAWVGSIQGASGEASDFTALGDNVNIAARLASNAAAGEVLISAATAAAAGIATGDLERRDLSLKGKSEPVTTFVLRAGD